MTQPRPTRSLRFELHWLCMLLVWVAAPAAAEPRMTGEVAIESKLLAPCCWLQTLDVHESPLASELRAEIRSKLTRAVPAADIESELVARYGERLWAIPPGHDPRSSIMELGFGAMALALLALCGLAWRWRRTNTLGTATDAVAGDALDRQLDMELRDLDA